MRVLLLSPYPQTIEMPILEGGDHVITSNASPSEIDFSADFIICFGYRHIIQEQILRTVVRPIINLHISYLPWNKGADPNFWSWFEHTPKGVSVHEVDIGIDTGPLLVQTEVTFSESEQETLTTSYNKLCSTVSELFSKTWPLIRANEIKPTPQFGKGSCHRSKDKDLWWKLLSNGYDSPVGEIENIGSEVTASGLFWDKYDQEIGELKSSL